MNEHEEYEQPLARDTTGEGYPEDSQPGTGIDAHDHAEDKIAPPDDDPPKSASKRDSEPSKATGNPRAAGG